MDGKPLYEYARAGLPLPRPIEQRRVTVQELELVDWIPGDDPRHKWQFPEKKFTDEERKRLAKALKGSEVKEEESVEDELEPSAMDMTKDPEVSGEKPPAFVLRMRVSGGTYVRSVAHDLGHALGSAAHVVTLTRSRQGRFCLELANGPGTNAEIKSPSSGSETIVPSTSASQVENTPKADSSEPKQTSKKDEDSEGEDSLSETAAPAKKKRKIKALKGPVAVEVREVKTPENPYASLEQKDDRLCVPWEVFKRALEDGGSEEPDVDGWREWEREVILRMEIVEQVK